jgi:regulatory protein
MRNSPKNLNRELSEKEITNKLYKYCAYQERAVSDVSKQLERYNVKERSKKMIIDKLIEEGFLNEERYAKTYMLSKLRYNKWGKIKIIHGLKEKSIDSNIIHKVIDTISEKEYIEIIAHLIAKKKILLQEKDIYVKKNKLARFLIYKGFESTIVWDQINKLIKN